MASAATCVSLSGPLESELLPSLLHTNDVSSGNRSIFAPSTLSGHLANLDECGAASPARDSSIERLVAALAGYLSVHLHPLLEVNATNRRTGAAQKLARLLQVNMHGCLYGATTPRNTGPCSFPGGHAKGSREGLLSSPLSQPNSTFAACSPARVVMLDAVSYQVLLYE